ncbi:MULTISPECIES: cell division ATP-binding protein FtsE [unclassified Methylophaga]|mgnify:FL=1|jgi:cell division transport system ATP-binding protein|uniref:cell division ATP-binding protein FtsE n=1 Tax=unclassified Methylophaga TaxID=2629249 RepID=UPI000C3514CA|nr:MULTISPECIES: cell division ATP-binding protein FtsE [unclassified Methylophaga]MAL49876.1 cell division ATP-binding protein FtsE [Methylophaga sp.]MAP27187.1 cell division ATP-binding protein FtsE [Methylophaga sp.]MBP24361.1 cell division ATP-binding protein FtsE [Methylophaga sp.]HBX60928.1 cell division ATP-binding protein FtsE [Methylophaga sp.]HCO01428.1 cell division ATP-binding protein FtsE [Methylophaga sp.]|tara:strand:- start:650 stop:1312 length:663 start_codon:yes stop_codon:yes gene_type:complete
MIRFEQVYKRYEGQQEALSGLSFELLSGEMAFLTGHSGAGKSTLLKLIALIERCSHGQVIVNNQNLSRLPKWKIPYYRRKIGLVFQDHNLLHDRTVFDNVALPLIIAGENHREIGRRVRAALDKVGLLGKERNLPIALSGGEQQRVGIARAVVNRPPVLLADEPTGNLDPELSREIMHLFEQFNQVGVTVFIASHDQDLISQLPYRHITLQQGRLAENHS